MNVANVCDRFAVLADVDSEELQRRRVLIEDACDYVLSRCIKEAPCESDMRRLELLSAAYALKLYAMCGDNQLREFVAGDVRLASSADGRQQAESLWRELVQSNSDLINAEGFLFGRVI